MPEYSAPKGADVTNNQRRRNAFTMIELLVVISIILILIGLLVIGLKVITANTGSNATKPTLESLLGMQAGYDVATHGTRPINTPALGLISANRPYAAGKMSVDAPPCMIAPPLASPTFVSRTESLPVMAAGQALAALLSIPENLQAVQKLPQSTAQIVTNRWSGSANYKPGDRVRYDLGANGIEFFECLIATSAAAPTVGPQWKHVESTLLDAFGNPIVYVPAGTPLIIGTYIGPSGANMPHVGDTVLAGSTYFVCIKENPPSPTAPLNLDYWRNAAVTSPDGRAFWASAGPDGDFGKPDDNIYSFQH
jgi:prepilin-type N-terminal cleavage/methylation domain-containing protein